ncbi:MAG: hypothetical protein KKE17_03095, partial [Proteobacteria bacterium]|nr:hypothetical protein [Pseudomonadota bacterium]MBU1708969.1 hypothetical protein [Pseudomonadota bacterium]
MEKEQRQLLKKYTDIVLRRKKTIVFFLLAGIVVGLGIYLKTPKVYQSTSLIMYQQQQINPSKFSPDLKKRTEEMVHNVSLQVTSRTSLEEVVKRYDLYP